MRVRRAEMPRRLREQVVQLALRWFAEAYALQEFACCDYCILPEFRLHKARDGTNGKWPPSRWVSQFAGNLQLRASGFLIKTPSLRDITV